MKSNSQAGQDLFAHAILGDGPGTFLDIGCNHPTEKSNSYALELLGWRGLLVDSDENAANMCKEQRKNPVLFADASKVNWRAQLQNHKLWPAIDYLSLDCDAATWDVLCALPLGDVHFRVITIEHDAYRFGDKPRTDMRLLLNKFGYTLVCGNVMDKDMPFEDWWVDMEKVDKALALRFAGTGRNWQEVFADAEWSIR